MTALQRGGALGIELIYIAHVLTIRWCGARESRFQVMITSGTEKRAGEGRPGQRDGGAKIYFRVPHLKRVLFAISMSVNGLQKCMCSYIAVDPSILGEVIGNICQFPSKLQ